MAKSKFPCPTWLDKEAKKEWKRIIKELEKSEDFRNIDIKALESYCQSYSRWRQCEEILQDEGYTFTTPNGYIQQRPEVTIGNKALESMRAWAKELGFTPAARSRMNKNNSPPNGDIDEELDGIIAR